MYGVASRACVTHGSPERKVEMRRYAALFLTLALLVPVALHAQTTVASRDIQIRQLESQRSMVLAMADSMPEDLYRDKVTPEQRDFSGQLFHVVGVIQFVDYRFHREGQPAQPDSASIFNTREGLKAYVNEVYDGAVESIRNQTEESRSEVIDFFGDMRGPRALIWDQINDHSWWTLGQVVANFRKHGMAPPAQQFF
jgi:hypothetical protein